MSLLTKVYAEVGNQVTDPLGGRFQSLVSIFGFLINVVIGIGWALVFIMLALGFIQYITSRGDTKATDKARQWLTFAALGGVGLFFLTAIRFIIQGLLGANNIQVNGITNFWGD